MVFLSMSWWSLFAAVFLGVLAAVLIIAGLVIALFGAGRSRLAGLLNVLFGWIVLFVFWYMYWDLSMILVILIILFAAVCAIGAAILLFLMVLMRT